MAHEQLRYVVLRHGGVEQPHFDLMFEQSHDAALATLRSPIWPIECKVALDHLGDHRRDYLVYEGPVSGGRGWVKRVESGLYVISEAGTGLWDCRLTSGPTSRHLILRRFYGPAERWEAEPSP